MVSHFYARAVQRRKVGGTGEGIDPSSLRDGDRRRDGFSLIHKTENFTLAGGAPHIFPASEQGPAWAGLFPEPRIYNRGSALAGGHQYLADQQFKDRSG